MDPTTVILVLAIHLVCSGGLYALIATGMPPRSGLGPWGVGCIMFGVAYMARLTAGLQHMPPWVAAMDVTMMVAVLLFVSGLRQFLGRQAMRWQTLAVAAALYALAHLLAYGYAGVVGRHLLQNAVLGALYALLAAEGLAGRRHQPAALKRPLTVLAVLIGGLGLLTVLRSASVLFAGTQSLYAGPYAQAYYGYASLAALLLELTLLWMVFVRLNGQLAELASRDALTRLLNRNGLNETVQRHFAARGAAPLTLLQIDIDHFKRINDRYGHPGGDRVLCAVAESLSAHVRGSDFVARVGGEEFLVGCVGADHGFAERLAERLRTSVTELRVVLEGAAEPLRCSVSIGVSPRCVSAAGWDAAWQQADRALYAAKDAGRDRVFLFDAGRGAPVPFAA
jgi:diguanylate cyclase (GGDEF)-like protein